MQNQSHHHKDQIMGRAKAVKKATKRNAPFVYATPDELKKEYTPDDHKELIRAELPAPKECTKAIYTQITPSYWRVTFWGKIEPENVFSAAYIITSKFIRIDIDSVGRLQYNDVTEGSRL